MSIFTFSWLRQLALLLVLSTLPALAQVPPGNALNFDGMNDYIVTSNSAGYFNYTVEAWVRTTNAATGDGGTIVSNYPNFMVGMYGGKARFRSYNTVNTSYDLVGTTLLNDGKWHHVAAVMGGGINYNMTLYVDGVAEGSRTGGYTNFSSTYIGSLQINQDPWQGSIDEVRIWDVAHSAAEIKTFFNNTVLPTEAGLLMNYTFDRGTAGGNNAGQTTEPNPVPRRCGGCPTFVGTLYNFALSGNTSNLIESYALMQPTNLAATSAASGTSLSVTWTPPPVGTVSNYVLDVSTTADFSAGVTTLTPAGSASSATVPGRTVNTSYYLRLKTDKTSVTGQSAYSRDVFNLRTSSGLTPPGNALAFDGSDDYVALPNTTPVPTGNSAYTLEAWIKPNAMGVEGIIGWGNWGVGNQVNALRLSPTGIINYWWGPDLVVTTPDLSGHWHHVAATFDGTTRTIYLDGVAVGSDTPGSHTVPSPSNLRIGCTNGPSPGGGYEYFNGSIDEVRIWNVARSAAQMKAAYTSWPAAPQAGLVAAYDFDAGTAGGANTGLTTLPDRSPNYQDGTLHNLSLANGNTTSNWVESYALVVPTLAATTAVTTAGFTVNWTAPLVGTVTGYVLDYSLSPTFATVAGTVSPPAGATSQAVSGLLPNRNYYYRLRADKTSGAVAGQGAYTSGTVRTASGLTPPGNALSFDGSDDRVSIPHDAAFNLPAAITLEAWVNTTSPGEQYITTKGEDSWYLALNGAGGAAGRASFFLNNVSTNSGGWLYGRTNLADGHWHYVVGTYDGSTLRLYVDGTLENSRAATGAVPTGTSPITLGARGNTLYWNGLLDEVRIWSVARTAAQVQAAYLNQPALPQSGLVAAYNFDHGTAGGSNATSTTLTDQSGNLYDGTLNNFALSSTVSNWVESYALVVPTLAAATANAATSFTANWTAPAIGTITNYVLDVATSNTFAAAALVAGSPITAAGASQAVTGLDPAQTYYYRVRADKAGSVSGQGAYSAIGTRAPFTPMTPPGNALALDGSDDYVTGNNPQLPQGNAARTLEAWVLTTASGSNVIVNYGTATSNQRSGILLINGHLYYVGENNDLQGNKVINDGHWHHVAATCDGTSLKLYVDGVLDVSNAQGAFNTTGFDWNIGKRIPPLTSTEQFNGRLDEVRIYNTALTPAQVQVDMTSTSPAVPASLVAYYNFDQGTAYGNNAGYTTLTDQSASGATGTLTNFSLTNGNTTSNWVESYALLQPTGLAASASTGTGFTASWMAPLLNGATPATGAVEGYVLDVSASSTFASGVTSFPVSGYGSTSVAVTGLTNGTNYYMRVRAEKASVTGQGDYSPTATTHTIGTDALLTNLTASAGQLSPAFATATLAYTLYVPTGTSTYTLMPTASNGYTNITVNGTAVTSGAASGALSVGSTATVVLTSEDGNATRTYTVQAVVAPTYFRSVATGTWSNPATWETSYDGSTGWFAAPVAPSGSYVGTVNVRNGHTVTVAAATSTKTTTVENGGILNTLTGFTLTIPNGATMTVNAGGVLSAGRLSGADGVTGTSTNISTISVAGANALLVNGTLVLNTGTSTPATQGINTATTTIGNGGRVVQYATTTSLSMPAPTWSAGSTLELAGGILNQTYVTVNQTLQNLDVNLTTLPAGALTAASPYLFTAIATTTVTGTLTVRSTGLGTLRLFNAPTTGTLTLGTVDGSGTRTGGYVQLAGTSVVGSFGGSNATTGTPITVQGGFQLNGGTYAAAQPTSTATGSLRATPLTVNGDFAVASGATFNLLSAATGPAINYVGGNVTLNGNVSNAGTVSTGNTASTTQKLLFGKASTAGAQTFSNTGTITGLVNTTVAGTTILDMGTSTLTGTGTFVTQAGATLRLGSPDGISASGTATGNVQSTGTRTFAAGTSFEFNGIVAQVTGTGFPPAALSAASTLAFNNAAGVTLSQALTTPGTLSLRQGIVTTTATNLLTLGTTATTTGTLDATATNTGRVAGPLKRWIAASTGSRDFPVGLATASRPATIAYTTAPTAGGTLMAEFVASPAGSQGLPLTENGNTATKGSDDGYWHFTAADGLTGGTYTATFTFSGISGVSDFSKLLLLKRADATADWALVGSAVATAGSNTAPILSRTDLTGFSDFTAGLTAAPLPVQLVSFAATAQGSAAVRLTWVTASELNSARFEVERSLDGISFSQIGQVPAAGNSPTAHTYGLTDATLPGTGILYYRLRQVDFNGTATYSPVRSIIMPHSALEFALYPNPTHTAATLVGAKAGATVQVYDALGRLVYTTTAEATGTAALALPAGLPTGVYLVRSGSQTARLGIE
ncbi:T9SS type A sorting domain-containing protein [Hymenobacter sp. HMF4947]|uniref:T9SS type A sorting domain-containing protein n=1 Tax=Hymenobacter ginkgonis TaxID=2682976 RepID=A0A7K1T9U4_9BACT|nr:LamG-like jellyroll fold domain-containing protein [Hymenobacter ginkgonis]MVN75178.1 T9SS type A sorting domain-containing protein [Hymenobacter ginkgonis]